jgi:hypothetical protein
VADFLIFIETGQALKMRNAADDVSVGGDRFWGVVAEMRQTNTG